MTLLSGLDTPHGQMSGRCAPKKWTTCGRCCKRSPGRSRMPDTVHHVMWYTVYDAKTGNLLASGTSDMCARRLGYKSANSFASSVYHCRKKKRKPHKYSFFQEVIKRDEVDSLPPIRRKKRRACPCANTDKPKG
nr:MAG TPA: hypothetical protein [Bacteriophage sp.]